VEVTPCCVPRMRWVVALWRGTPLALARDATACGVRCVVLTVHGVSRGWALPGAWTIVPANTPGAWRRAWLRMLRHLRPALPPDWTVRVRTDRGLGARWRLLRIVRVGWHPLLRITPGATFCPQGQPRG
jgi:hypothetical protein